jgi:hypothetical protein
MSEDVFLKYTKQVNVPYVIKLLLEINDEIFDGKLEFNICKDKEKYDWITVNLNKHLITTIIIEQRHRKFYSWQQHCGVVRKFLECIIVENLAKKHKSRVWDWNEGKWYEPRTEQLDKFYNYDIFKDKLDNESLKTAYDSYLNGGVALYGSFFKEKFG